MADAGVLLEPVLALHAAIRAAVVEACARQGVSELSAVAAEVDGGGDAGDTIYEIDRVSEETLVRGMEEIARTEPLCLVAEGIPGGSLALPRGAREEDCRWRILVDPIDGTRGIMYQKRSAWILTGVASNRGPATRLRDIELAVQTEIPLLKQHLSDQLWARRGGAVHARRFNRLTGGSEPLALRPSRSDTLAHGFATLSRFFPGARDVMAAVDDELVREVLGAPEPGRAACFEDQYACTGGQLYELMAGHDRFIADLRPLLAPILEERGIPRALCCHPYDICTALIAERLGVVVTGLDGEPVDAPMDLEADVAWLGFANERLRDRVAPVLRRVLERHGLLRASDRGRGRSGGA